LNARSFDVPWGQPMVNDAGVPTAGSCSPPAMPPQLGRNDPLAMRNPLFAYMTWQGCGVPTMTGDHTLTARDLTWRFTVNGGFSPLQINISGTSATSVSPQSMLFIGALGQLGVVDGSQQGLVIIDLNSVSVVANYF
jgi:hypothetical protein